MSREHWNGYGSSPDELPYSSMERDRSDEEMPRKRWRAEDVAIYRQALKRIGIEHDSIERLVARDCGSEWSEAPMLSVRQAGG